MKRKNDSKAIIYNINLKAQSWCLKRGYKIYPVKAKGVDSVGGKINKFNIVMEFNNKKTRGTKEYLQHEWSQAIWNMYSFLYEKNALLDGE